MSFNKQQTFRKEEEKTWRLGRRRGTDQTRGGKKVENHESPSSPEWGIGLGTIGRGEVG